MKSPIETIPTTNKHLVRWVDKMAELCQPAQIHWVDGSLEEYQGLCNELVRAGTFTRLNEEKWPGCFLARSSPTDVARVEDRTFICSLSKDNAGPTNNWEDPFVMRKKLRVLFEGSMRGRTMYVLPFSMGPIGSPMSQLGVQLTDSAYVVLNMRIMARITDQTEHVYGEARYAAGSWKQERRVIIKAEVVRAEGKEPKDNPRVVITNMRQSPQWLYEKVYCQRGEIENRISNPLLRRDQMQSDCAVTYSRARSRRRCRFPQSCTEQNADRDAFMNDPG